MDFGQAFIIGLSLTLAVGYVLGLLTNRRRGVALYRWLREGVEAAVGKIGEARWIGSAASGARLSVPQAKAPFRQVEMAFLLESRELWPLWLINRLRGRQDELILKATLRHQPRVEWELSPPANGKELLSQGFTQGLDLGARRLLHKGTPTPEEQRRYQDFFARYGAAVQAFSLRRERPHLVLRVHIGPLYGEAAQSFFEALSALLQPPHA